jgi:hypothetical protein
VTILRVEDAGIQRIRRICKLRDITFANAPWMHS